MNDKNNPYGDSFRFRERNRWTCESLTALFANNVTERSMAFPM